MQVTCHYLFPFFFAFACLTGACLLCFDLPGHYGACLLCFGLPGHYGAYLLCFGLPGHHGACLDLVQFYVLDLVHHLCP